MCGTLLFCISELAFALTSDVLSVEAEESGGHFSLVESRAGPPIGQHFKRQLGENQTFHTDFINATPQECQRWAFERQKHDNSVDQGLIAILDERSARDGTLLIQIYNGLPEGCEPLIFGRYGELPPERDVWYDFRIDYHQAAVLSAGLTMVTPEIAYPIYYENKERFTDEHGVFDVREASRFGSNRDPDVKEADLLEW
ncbi:hypothetical protein K431DRAFT_331304 [Polychaeton citri CBS 116435]|uniref:Uncharacterized protein n=1 Tax=Polychaeton citri CBS 116435 TaxID=1314669 RepID=A0A9P4UM80_9PEZI|nr:hypothetical protein K431DRAFT_331304 [Polychaeton citri CBS 116435]